MGKSYENLIDVMCMLDIYVENNHNFVTVNQLYQYMKDEYEISERTVRRCLDTLLGRGLLEQSEVGNTTVYVVENRDLLPSGSQIYRVF